MNKLTKLFALLLVVALASTTFYVGTQLNSTVYPLGDGQNAVPIDLESPLEFDPLHVSLNGESKLHVNVSSVYEAVVSGGSGNFSYAWGVEPVDEKVVFEYSGSTCSFMFVVATVDPYTLSVEVTDLVSGDKAFDSFTVYDPYTLPDLYLESSLADFVCRVKSDGAGWYFVSDGESGKTLFSSTVLLDATDYALTSTTSGNILLDGVYFDYSLTIPVGVSVTESVDGLVRVFVNEADRQGSPYTVSVDSVHPTYYLVQDGMGRFINDYSSVNFKSVYDAVSAVLTVSGGTIVLRSGDTFTATSGLSGVSNVSVEGYGATLQVQSNTGGVHALTFDSIVDSVWRGVNVERVGADAGNSHVLYVSGVTDESVRFLDCNFTNSVTGTATGCYGVYSSGSACPSFSSCIVTGGSGGTSCHGVSLGGSACPSFSNCPITGGSGGTGCYGVISGGSACPSFSDCPITGGSGGTSCHGVYSVGSACPSFSDCPITGGSGGTNCNGVSLGGSSCPSFSDCTIDIQTFSSSWSYSSADDGRFQPFSTHPYILRGIYVNVASATSGVTLDLGTSVSGTEIASGIDISSTGAKYFNFTSPVEVTGDGYFYATPSGVTVDGAFTVYYIVSTNYATNYGVLVDTKGYMLMSGCTVISNGASDALRINSNSVSYPYFKVTNCHLESLDATNQYAVSASGALADAPIYNSVLVHNLLNVTPDAGTQQGTNWQDPLVAYQEALPISNEYVTKLLNLVAKERLDHTTLYFTSTPLTDLVSLEGLSGKDLDDAILANKNIEVQNALLIKEAKSLAQIVLERTDKTVEEIVPADEKIAPPVYLDKSPIK